MTDSENPRFFQPDKDPEPRFAAIGPWDDTTRADMQRRLSEPERRSLADRIREIVGLGEPAYAVSESDLPSGAVAVILRDPGEKSLSRVIVFGAATLTDETVALARGVLMQSEVAEPRLSLRRLITLWLDGRYQVREGQKSATGKRDWQKLSAIEGAAECLQKAASAGKWMVIPEVGPIRLAITSLNAETLKRDE